MRKGEKKKVVLNFELVTFVYAGDLLMQDRSLYALAVVLSMSC